jgi:hypothetical protein
MDLVLVSREEGSPVQRQIGACDLLLADAELLPDTLEVELRLYRERLAAALAPCGA